MRQRQVEVLAPAGSFESMKAAVAAGADAVYIGGSQFGARAYADNLDEDHMIEAIHYAHLHGVSLYMTVNTLVKEKELDSLFDYLNPYYMAGLDAVIVQDMGVFTYIREHFPDLDIHASTQMTITGAEGASLLKNMGASRVVPARELSLEEIARIHREVGIEIECFVHGALCYCYSGQCLLSSLIGGRSGNRGRCAQPCRLPYDVRKDGHSCQPRDERYVMSLKDLCVLDILPDILEAGVYSLKIEGRMKSPRYTAGVVSIYRKYVDRYLKSGRKGYHVDPRDKKTLLDLFDRGGFTDGYYVQHNGRDMVALKEKPAFRQGNQELFDYLDTTYVNAELKESITGNLVVEEGKPVSLVLSCTDSEGETVTVQADGAVVMTAQNQPMTEEKLRKQIQKTGNTPFQFADLTVSAVGNVFLPVQALNELRRTALEKLEQELLGKYRRESGKREVRDAFEVKTSQALKADQNLQQNEQNEQGKAAENSGVENSKGLELHVLLDTADGFDIVLGMKAVRELQLESDGFEPDQWNAYVSACHEAGKRCVLAFPVIFRTEAIRFFEKNWQYLAEAGFDGLLVRSMEEIVYVKEKGLSIPLFGDHNLYVFNQTAKETYDQMGLTRQTLPLELNSQELEQLGCAEMELVAYGYLPVMTSAQCIQKTTDRCTHRSGLLRMRDRTGKDLTVKNRCTFCYNTIYNPSPLSLLGQEHLIRRLAPGAIRLQFTWETKEQIRQIVQAYEDVFLEGKTGQLPFTDITRGHFKRGVE